MRQVLNRPTCSLLEVAELGDDLLELCTFTFGSCDETHVDFDKSAVAAVRGDVIVNELQAVSSVPGGLEAGSSTK